jgi:hypothetical protein
MAPGHFRIPAKAELRQHRIAVSQEFARFKKEFIDHLRFQNLEHNFLYTLWTFREGPEIYGDKCERYNTPF